MHEEVERGWLAKALLLGAKCRHVATDQATSQGTNLCHVAILSLRHSALLGGWLHVRLCWSPLANKLASCDFVSQCE
jgi:hypothetical protein